MSNTPQMTPEARIFELIDSIKSKITSQKYIDLMNTAKELIEKIPEIENIPATDDNSLSNSEIEETPDSHPCECLSKFRYPDEFPIMDTHQMFCSGINIFECENFKLFCEDHPLMYNLLEKQNMPFTNRETHSSYVLQHMKMIFSIFFTLINILDCKRHKIITTIVFYDFAIRNIQFLFDNNQLARISYDKFVFFIVDVEFIQIADEFDINLENWRVALENAANSIIT